MEWNYYPTSQVLNLCQVFAISVHTAHKRLYGLIATAGERTNKSSHQHESISCQKVFILIFAVYSVFANYKRAQNEKRNSTESTSEHIQWNTIIASQLKHPSVLLANSAQFERTTGCLPFWKQFSSILIRLHLMQIHILNFYSNAFFFSSNFVIINQTKSMRHKNLHDFLFDKKLCSKQPATINWADDIREDYVNNYFNGSHYREFFPLKDEFNLKSNRLNNIFNQ